MREHLGDHGVNPSSNPTFAEIDALRVSRRDVLRGGLGAAAIALAGPAMPGAAFAQSSTPASASSPLLGFTSVPLSTADTVVVPPGYTVDVVYAWGDPIGDGPRFKPDASNTAADQEQQAGMHHDGMHFFPLPKGSGSSTRGLLVVNHEYTDDGLLHPGGFEPWTAEKVAKSQAAHGVSVVELALADGRWQVRPSPLARRITARTPMRVDGPVAGHALLRTAADPTGRRVLGTLNNCAHGVTPWGTYLTCEENFNFYFANATQTVPGAASPGDAARALAMQTRYGIATKDRRNRWLEHDERFDTSRHPNEPNRFGWVVEIDPFDPSHEPVKHTALGRIKHEGAAVTLARDGRVVVYMGDDERFEYIYKFVSARAYDPAAPRAAHLSLLEEGTLYVARLGADGSGTWIDLTHGAHGLDAASGFNDQAEVLVAARAAADRVGGTKMDRPEWITVHPTTGECFATLTNNTSRGKPNEPGTDAANPRANNAFGHIIRWRDGGGDAGATKFAWEVFVLAGYPDHKDPAKRGNVKGDAFGSPDGLWVDPRGVLWIQTDVSTTTIRKGYYAALGNNMMLAADPTTGEVRRFLVGPNGCEITGITATPDGRSLFVNIQHPGETASEISDSSAPLAVSGWPDGPAGGRPRSATVVIRKLDGGVIGT